MPETGSQAPFVVKPVLTAIAIGYRNEEHTLIADRCMPYIGMTITTEEYSYKEYMLDETMTLPEMEVGRLGKVPSVEFTHAERTGRTTDKGLQHPLPKKDLDAAKANNYNIRGRTTEGLTDLIDLGREVRVARIMGDPANYGNNVTTLSTADQLTNPDADPVKTFREIIFSMLLKPTSIAMGPIEWLHFSQHPKVVAAISGSGKTEGTVTKQQVADLLEIKEVLVGEAWMNVSKKGLESQRSRAWGGFISFFHRNSKADTQMGVTFGLSVRRGKRKAGTIQDANIGAEGGEWVRLVEANDEKVVCAEAGHLILNPV